MKRSATEEDRPVWLGVFGKRKRERMRMNMNERELGYRVLMDTFGGGCN